MEGPLDDESVHPGALACRIRAWKPGTQYSNAKPELVLTLTEFADPDGEAVYLRVPNPRQDSLVDDELITNCDLRV